MPVFVPAIEVRHHRFELAAYEALDAVLATEATAGFALIRIVPVDEAVGVAVFERPIPSDKPPDKR